MTLDSHSNTPPIETDPVTVHQRMTEGGDMILLDCREDDEFRLARIAGAHLLPMSRWEEAIPVLQDWIGKSIVVYCHHGARSLRVTSWLRENGFPTAQSMQGGIDAWSQLVDPSISRY